MVSSTIPYVVAAFLTTAPCQSHIESLAGQTLAHQCPMPPVAGPPRPPIGWVDVNDAAKAEAPTVAAPAPKQKATKKTRKHRAKYRKKYRR